MYTCMPLWSFRPAAWKQQIGGVVYLHLSYSSIDRIIGCCIQEGFFISLL